MLINLDLYLVIILKHAFTWQSINLIKDKFVYLGDMGNFLFLVKIEQNVDMKVDTTERIIQ